MILFVNKINKNALVIYIDESDPLFWKKISLKKYLKEDDKADVIVWESNFLVCVIPLTKDLDKMIMILEKCHPYMYDLDGLYNLDSKKIEYLWTNNLHEKFEFGKHAFFYFKKEWDKRFYKKIEIINEDFKNNMKIIIYKEQKKRNKIVCEITGEEMYKIENLYKKDFSRAIMWWGKEGLLFLDAEVKNNLELLWEECYTVPYNSFYNIITKKYEDEKGDCVLAFRSNL